MATTKEARGTKRTCQNEDCEAKFYDLNRDPIVCPICDTVYKLAPELHSLSHLIAKPINLYLRVYKYNYTTCITFPLNRGKALKSNGRAIEISGSLIRRAFTPECFPLSNH